MMRGATNLFCPDLPMNLDTRDLFDFRFVFLMPDLVQINKQLSNRFLFRVIVCMSKLCCFRHTRNDVPGYMDTWVLEFLHC